MYTGKPMQYGPNAGQVMPGTEPKTDVEFANSLVTSEEVQGRNRPGRNRPGRNRPGRNRPGEIRE
jgi:hypothetical protein